MKTNKGLCEYALAQIGKPYWFGTFGQTASKKLYEEKKKQYPRYYTASDYPSQYGERVHDCVGLIKGYLWSETPTSPPKYNPKQDLGADGMYRAARKKGEIKSFDKVNGRLVFKGTDKKKTHVGVYYNGYVLEAKGHSYGVKKTKFNASSWTYWCQCHLIAEADAEAPKEKPVEKPVEKPQAKKTVTAKNLPDKKSEKYERSFKVTASSLNMREGAGKLKQNEVMTVIPNGKVVTCNGGYTRYAGEDWLFVDWETVKDGKPIVYRGFCCGTYLK